MDAHPRPKGQILTANPKQYIVHQVGFIPEIQDRFSISSHQYSIAYSQNGENHDHLKRQKKSVY